MKKMLMAVGVALALTVSARAADKTDQLPLDDQFLIKAVEGQNNMTRILELVDSRSQNDKVRQFAKDVLTEQKRAGQKLADVAKERKLTVVAGPNKEAKDEYDRLSKEKGATFDKDFLATFIRCHEKAVSMCENQMKSGKVTTLNTCAKTCMTTLDDQLKRAKELQKSVGK